MLTPLIDQYHILFSSLSMLVSLMFGSLLLFSTELIHYTIFTGALRQELVCATCAVWFHHASLMTRCTLAIKI